MQTLLDKIDAQLQRINETTDYRTEATQLERVNTIKVVDRYSDVLIKAEFCCGKTFSLGVRKDEILYVSHRTSLILQNQHFAETTTINSLPKIGHINEFKYIVLDEIVGVFGALHWDQIDIERVINKLQEFDGTFIALDRDASPRFCELLSKLTNRNFHFYHHKTSSRNKLVQLAHNVIEMLDSAESAGYGVKLILCNTVARVKEIHRELDGRGHKVDSITSGNRKEAFTILEEAETHGNCYVIASPTIQEGVSLTSEKYVFTAYVQDKNDGMLTPVFRGMQALHRVRNPKAWRVVCCMVESEGEVIDEEALKNDLFFWFAEALGIVREAFLANLSGVPIEEFFGNKMKVFEVFSYLKYVTSVQNAAPIDSWINELEKSGYTPIYQNKKDDFDRESEDEQEIDRELQYGFKFNHSHRKETLTMSKEDFMKKYGICERRYKTLKFFGPDISNYEAEVAEFYPDKYDALNWRYKIALNFRREIRISHLFSEIEEAKFRGTAQILKDCIGDNWMYFGAPDYKHCFEIKKSDIKAHPKYESLKKVCGKEDAKNMKWFSTLLKDFHVKCESYGKGRSKYRIDNDIYLDLKAPQIRMMIS